MKKFYVKPDMEVFDVEIETYMATFSNPEDAEDSEEADANNRRGTWGDLWSE